MSSLINPTNIDITYPVAGQDNDTQGFRTNFTNIKNNFVQASLEITALQANTMPIQNGVFYGNVVTALISNPTSVTLSSNVNIVGNLTTNGARIEAGYQYNAPTTNFSYTVNTNVYRFILDPTGAITNGAVTLPSANVDATVVRISSTQTVTNFQVLPNTGTTLVPSANITLTGGTGVEYLYHAVEKRWYKVQ
jgi:hypothetical protein